MFESSCRAVKLKKSFCGHLLLTDGVSAISRVEKSSGMLIRSLLFPSAARRQVSVGPYTVKTSGVMLELFTVKTIFPHRSLFFYDSTNAFLSIHDESIRCICKRKSTHSRYTRHLILLGTQRKLTSVCSYRFCCSSKTTAAELWISNSRSICRHNHNLLLGLRSPAWERNPGVYKHTKNLWPKNNPRRAWGK